MLDYLVDEGSQNLYSTIGQRSFMSFIILILKSKESPEQQRKILGLIGKWGERFENQRDIVPNYYEMYNSLKKSGINFQVYE